MAMKGKYILKALKCCVQQNCNECPYEESHCMYVIKDALDFIDSLKAERNKYKDKAWAQKGELARLNKQVAEQKAEIKRLQEEVISLRESGLVGALLYVEEVEVILKDDTVGLKVRLSNDACYGVFRTNGEEVSKDELCAKINEMIKELIGIGR